MYVFGCTIFGFYKLNYPLYFKYFIVQLIHNILYVDTIIILKYLKVLQHISDHTGSIIRQPCTVLG